MFKFNFLNDENVEDSKDVNSENNRTWSESRQINSSHIAKKQNLKTNLLKIGNFNIKYVESEQVIEDLRSTEAGNNSVLNAEQNHSDLVPSMYEGGLKVWECTFDLISFLKDKSLEFQDKHVLDLGCGTGILGIYACLNNANVVFQDYNVEVISGVTIPNVRLNALNEESCSFYSGDWGSFLELMNGETKFDYILTSETIYNTENYYKLTNIFKSLLKQDGTIYLASKSYYFGVGGSLSQFQNELNKINVICKTVWECNDAIKRAIIEIKLK